MSVLTIDNLYKQYGYIQALKGVSFAVPEGSVYGILGPNGSGKTTLLGIILNVLKPTTGTFTLMGQPPAAEVRKNIGTLLETPNFYHYLNAVQNLQITAAIKGKPADDIDRVLDIVNLTERKFSRFSTYSLGMKQRLAIGAALLGDPDVLIFDEPTNGLDPVGIAEIRALIQKLNQSGKTIIMASHLLDEVEKVCTHVAILKKGVLITDGHVDEILINDDIVEVSASNMEALLLLLEAYPGCTQAKIEGQYVEAFFPNSTARLEDINRYCFEKGITVNHLRLRRKSLEAKFFELTAQTN